jgi:galactose-6-phosphate isomerase
MSQLDFSAVLTDPLFLDYYTVMRRSQVISTSGIASTNNVTTPNVAGVVYPSEPNDLQRLPDDQVMSKTLTIITNFALYGEAEAAGTEYQPDLVDWNGDSFVVRLIEDWSNYGTGFIKAICTSIDLVDSPPDR